MSKEISIKEFEDMKKIKGEVRGTTLRGYADFVIKEEGEEVLSNYKKELGKFGFPKEIRDMEFYPVYFQTLALETISRMLNYSKDDFQRLGRFSAKISIVVRLFAKYFFSVNEMMKHTSRMWEKSYTFGKVEIGKYNLDERYLALRLKDFAVHPFHGQVLIGYFCTLLQMIGGDKAFGEEVKSPFEGGEYYEFLLKW